MTLRNRVCLVVGVTGAIGAAVARRFAADGARLAVGSRTALPAECEQNLRRDSAGYLPVRFDICDWRSVESAIANIQDSLGPVSALVNCTGAYGPIGPTASCNVQEWAHAIEVNVLGSFHLARAVLPSMLARNYGRIVNFSGGGGAYGRPLFTAYAASKAAVVRFTESLAGEVRDSNITVNAVAPGAVKSRMWEQLRAAGEKAGATATKELAAMDAGGGVSPDRAAALVALLCSDANRVSGRLISAPYDAWEHMNNRADEIMNSDAGTLRRIPLGPTQ